MFSTQIGSDAKFRVFDVLHRFGEFHLTINMNIRAGERSACLSWTDNVELHFGKPIRRRREKAFVKMWYPLHSS